MKNVATIVPDIKDGKSATDIKPGCFFAFYFDYGRGRGIDC
jgi:hypothetical protein